MPRAFIEDRATLAPSKCVISGSGDGPIINTGMDYGDFRPRGRVYIAPRSIAHLLRELGWTDPDDTAKRVEQIEEMNQQIASMAEELEKLRPLAEAIEGFSTHTVEEVEVEKVVVREPTIQDIREFIDNNPTDPRVDKLEEKDRRSTEFWYQVYGDKGPLTHDQQQKQEAEQRRAAAKATRRGKAERVNPNEDSEPQGEYDPKAPPKTVTLHGQDVNLDDLLDGTVKDIVAFIDGHPPEFQEAVLKREVYRAEQKDSSPRVTLTKAVADNLDAESVGA